MIVDTSVWVQHFRSGDQRLRRALEEGLVWTHPFVIGELACSGLHNRTEVLALLSALPVVEVARHEEVMHLVDQRQLVRRGIGWIDVHLLASALISREKLWTIDRKLAAVASDLGAAH